MSDLQTTPELEALLTAIEDNVITPVILTDAFVEAWREMKELGAAIHARNAVDSHVEAPDDDDGNDCSRPGPNGVMCTGHGPDGHETRLADGTIFRWTDAHASADRREAVTGTSEKHDTAVKNSKRTPKPLPENWEPDDDAKGQLAEQGFDEAGRKILLQEYRQAMVGETSGRWTSKRFLKWWDEEKVKRATRNAQTMPTAFSMVNK